ncbi:hypothetical protein [Streptomyces nodosus]|uniref:DNA methylase N-4/N-6 domain-containing protein n=1 Tax=Streptomyces nodosus TaxID=40318 RepID=A0A0B5D6P9_9ACTN|nr:hypothetical protein [Streptomyces nodosus]AJE38918.1 hypothetical protein SNOD_01740 [Streptomyces nodosus]MBB4789740.1 hypothetical protein [Streptomyces nodosus]QEV37501.1 hypothetical protein CP978_02110 [Streptomyces nodosus]
MLELRRVGRQTVVTTAQPVGVDGSGSTGIAALASGRPFIGIEGSEQIAATARSRLAAAA